MKIGIDLGTTNATAAYHDGSSITIIESPAGDRFFPSVVSLPDSGAPIVGREAKRLLNKRPDYTYQNIKRVLGHRYDDNEHDDYRMRRGEDGQVAFQGPDRVYSATELISHIISAVLKAAELQLGKRPDSAVITVPVKFDDQQRNATKRAAQKAGLKAENVHILEEPTAAGLAFGADQQKFSKTAVFDLGGGTFDISIMNSGRGHNTPVAQGANGNLGGSDFDEKIAEYIVEKHRELGSIADITADNDAMVRVYQAAEEAKISLSTITSANILLKDITIQDNGTFDVLDLDLSRSKMEELNRTHFSEIQRVCETALRTHKIDVSDIDNLILVGAMTRMPAIRKLAIDIFGKEPLSNISPEIVVAQGAAIHAATLDQKITGTTFQQKTAYAVGVLLKGGNVLTLIPRNSKLPFSKEAKFGSKAKDQKHCSFKVLQGDLDVPESCTVVMTHHESVSGEDDVIKFKIEQDADGLISAFVNEKPVKGG